MNDDRAGGSLEVDGASLWATVQRREWSIERRTGIDFDAWRRSPYARSKRPVRDLASTVLAIWMRRLHMSWRSDSISLFFNIASRSGSSIERYTQCASGLIRSRYLSH